MRALIAAVTGIALALPATAGGMAPPVMEDEVVLAEAPVSSGGFGPGAILVPLLAIAVVTVAAAQK